MNLPSSLLMNLSNCSNKCMARILHVTCTMECSNARRVGGCLQGHLIPTKLHTMDDYDHDYEHDYDHDYDSGYSSSLEEDGNSGGSESADGSSDSSQCGELDLDESIASLLKKGEKSAKIIMSQFEALTELEVVLPSESAEVNSAFVTLLEANVLSFAQKMDDYISNIQQQIIILTGVVSGLQAERDALDVSSFYHDGVNPGDWEDEAEERESHIESSQNSRSAERLKDAIDDLMSILSEVEDVDLEERLTKANQYVKWIKVLVYIICAEFKPRFGGAAHPSFLNNNAPDGSLLTSGLLLELFATMIFSLWKKGAERVGGGGDGGVDILVGPNKKIPCQVKNYSSRMGPAVVRELIGTMVLRKVKTAYMVYSQGAELTAGVKEVVEQAKERGYNIHILTTPRLVKLTKRFSVSFSAELLVSDTLKFDSEFDLLSSTEIESINNDFGKLVQEIKDLKEE